MDNNQLLELKLDHINNVLNDLKFPIYNIDTHILYDGSQLNDKIINDICNPSKNYVIVYNINCQNVYSLELRRLHRMLNTPIINTTLRYVCDWHICYSRKHYMFIFDDLELLKAYLGYYTMIGDKEWTGKLKPIDQINLENYDWNLSKIKFSEFSDDPNCLKGINHFQISSNISNHRFLKGNELLYLNISNCDEFINVIQQCKKLVRLVLNKDKDLNILEFCEICQNATLKTLIVDSSINISLHELLQNAFINNSLKNLYAYSIMENQVFDSKCIEILNKIHNVKLEVYKNAILISNDNLIQLISIIEKNKIYLRIKCKLTGENKTIFNDLFRKYYHSHHCCDFLYKSIVYRDYGFVGTSLEINLWNVIKIQRTSLVKLLR